MTRGKRVILLYKERRASEMTDIVQFVAQVGFPIAVATWLLVKLQVSLDNFATAARELAGKIEVHTSQCAKCQEYRQYVQGKV